MTTPAIRPHKTHRPRYWPAGIAVTIITLTASVTGCATLSASQASSPNSASTRSAGAPAGTAAPSGPAELPLGNAASISQGGAAAATIFLDQLEVSSQPADQYSQGPQNGYFVVIRVRVTGAAGLTSGFDINPLDFYALAGSTHYDEGDGNAFEGPHSGDNLSATTLNAGESTVGWLLFDLPSPHGKVVYAPNLGGQPLAYWKF